MRCEVKLVGRERKGGDDMEEELTAAKEEGSKNSWRGYARGWKVKEKQEVKECKEKRKRMDKK